MVYMPLAFTQEDFLVFMQFSGKISQIVGRRPLKGWSPFWEILDPSLLPDF